VSKLGRSSLARLFMAFVFVAAVSVARADQEATAADWAGASFQYNVVDQDLREVFREYSRQLGIIVQLSDRVHGRVRNLNIDTTAGDFLDRLATDHDLVWYYDGSILHIATTGEVVMQAIPTEGVPFDRLSAALDARSRTDRRLGLRPGPDADLVYVTGPASYFAFVEQTAATLKEPPFRVRVYRGGQLSGS
jgi:type III secretion protein C